MEGRSGRVDDPPGGLLRAGVDPRYDGVVAGLCYEDGSGLQGIPVCGLSHREGRDPVQAFGKRCGEPLGHVLGYDDRRRQVRGERGEERIKHRRASGRRAYQDHRIGLALLNLRRPHDHRERDEVFDLLDEFPLDPPDVRDVTWFEHEVVRPEPERPVGHIGLP
ncbi:hypothetical protein DSECCO2_472430 [anaerobic digester metagenome]